MAATAQTGLILAPYITGAAEFYSVTELEHSQHILSDLTGQLIGHNRLGLALCELDGQALYFFGSDTGARLPQVHEQARHWATVFHSRRLALKRDIFCDCGACVNVNDLGLRIVAQRGEFSVQTVQGRTRIHGREPMRVRALLEAEGEPTDCLLATAALLEDGAAWPADAQRGSMELPALGSVSYARWDLSALRDQPLPPREESRLVRQAHKVAAEIDVEAPLPAVVALVGDLRAWPRWLDGLERMELDFSEPVRPGHSHVCYLREGPLPQTLERLAMLPDSFSMALRMRPPRPVAQGFSELHAERRGAGTRVRLNYGFTMLPLLGWMFEWRMRPALTMRVQRSLANLKRLAESGGDPPHSARH